MTVNIDRTDLGYRIACDTGYLFASRYHDDLWVFEIAFEVLALEVVGPYATRFEALRSETPPTELTLVEGMTLSCGNIEERGTQPPRTELTERGVKGYLTAYYLKAHGLEPHMIVVELSATAGPDEVAQAWVTMVEGDDLDDSWDVWLEDGRLYGEC